MADHLNPQAPGTRARPLGGTEYNWCKAVPTGTGITALVLLFSKRPDIHLLETAFHNLQNAHPILRSKLHYDTTTNSFSFLTPSIPNLRIQLFDLTSTTHILQDPTNNNMHSNQCQAVLEHELNKAGTWLDPNNPSDLLHVSVYTLSDMQWAMALRLHTSACDRASAVTLLRDLLEITGRNGDGIEMGCEKKVEVSLGIEELIPSGKANKPFWARGVDLLGYSLNAFRLSNLNFVETSSPRRSQVVRLQMNQNDTQRLLAGCKSQGIKLCGALAAAGLIAARASKHLPDQHIEKYAVVTLMDCRSILDPVLSSHHLGFYHSAILNTHDIVGGENLWELARRCYLSFSNAKNSNKHFTDMSDLNFLMCKAIDNPALTPSSSMRTAFVSVFEDPVIDEPKETHQVLGVEDYMGCASVHGVGPSIAIFDTVRDGRLDCACVYPSPLHSREQIQNLIDDMGTIIVEACNRMENGS
ncbi:Condensation domain-containing protein [Cephalotus follicularis]|uniref:Condensation domain-containing protein n=1 Tax=Cephalotus follicularis TaxID=3775 RepID=A0A1Q3AN64_CEPFO|nr:Condensation domain-containing protein [Cephalotus follicularis]